MSNREAQLCEIFSSFQGEGLYLGEKQVFIRFAGCNLSCQWCDTPQALVVGKTYKIIHSHDKNEVKTANNPATIEEVISIVEDLCKAKGTIHSVSLTGGEPLLQVDFLKTLLPQLKAKNRTTYLDTNGTLPGHLEEIIDHIDIVALDFKVPSSAKTSSYLSQNKKSLEIASLVDVFVKIVVTHDMLIKEFEEAVQLIASVNPKAPLIIQPVTPFGPIKHRPAFDQLMAWHTLAKRHLNNVRVVPQTHKIMGIL